MSDMPRDCVLHGDRLTRIEVTLESLRDDYLEGIKEQVEKTNGRVTALEEKVTTSRAWIYFLWICLGVSVAFISGLLVNHITADKLTDLQQLVAK